MRHSRFLLPCLLAATAWGQSGPDLQRILDRLDRLEHDNASLRTELGELRKELAASRSEQPQGAPLSETVAVEQSRTEELAQTKVEASQRMPLTLTGMLLFNAFQNGRHSGTSQDPVTANLNTAGDSSGASLRQTVLGLKFNGPSLPGGGTASGSLYMDFVAGSRDPSNNLLRIRTAALDLTWKNTTVTFGQDKPIIAPREPDSLAQVAVSPLTGAGNLWDWQPQARVEQRFHFSDNSGLRAQLGIYQTSEADASVPAAFARTLEHARPGYEGRFDFWTSGATTKFEIAPGFHWSDTHVAGTSVPSRIVSFDALARPASFVEFTGAWFRGENVAVLGALRQGFVILPSGRVLPVHSTGGWGQAAVFLNPRLTAHFFAGQQRDRASDLNGAGISRNFTFAGNLMYRIAPNILVSFEASQVRTNYIGTGTILNNHYDLALAYLF